jgi:hypothetical protein
MSNLLDDWKALGQKDINAINPSSAFPLLRWASGNEKNLLACEKINEYFFRVPNTFVISMLVANCKTGFYKYPKKTKLEEDERGELIQKYICKIYNWSKLEYRKNKKIINEENAIELIKNSCGLDKKECRILGVEYGTIKKYKFVENKPKPAGLANFL